MQTNGLFQNNSIQGASTDRIQQLQPLDPVKLSQKNQASQQFIKGLTPGQTLQGTIIEKNGNEALIDLGDNVVVSAKLGQEMSLTVGKMITFEVRANGQQLQLSPLHTNTAVDPNLMRAIQMANLPINQTTVDMTKAMMQAGMRVDRESLLKTFGEIREFQANPTTVVDLHRLQVPVTASNLSQMETYHNLSSQLDEGLRDVAGKMQDALLDLVSRPEETETAAKLFSHMLELAGNHLDELLDDGNSNGNEAAATNQNTDPLEGQVSLEQDNGMQLFGEEGNQPVLSDAANRALEMLRQLQKPDSVAENGTGNAAGNATGNVAGSETEATSGSKSVTTSGISSGSLPGALLNNVSGNMLDKMSDKMSGNMPSGDTAIDTNGSSAWNADEALGMHSGPGMGVNYGDLTSSLRDALSNALQELIPNGQMDAKAEFSDIFDAFRNQLSQAIVEHDFGKMQHILQNEQLRNGVLAAIGKQWTITPKQVADDGEVTHLYQRLRVQLEQAGTALEQAGLKNHASFGAVQNLQQNLDFLQQVNQMYTYVQLPIRFASGNQAHGDLYVYSNGKKISSQDGRISALLHLDMANIGPLDAYVALDRTGLQNKVTTQFTVANDDVLDLLAEHMDELTRRLEDKGYHCSCQMRKKGEPEVSEEGFPMQKIGTGLDQLLISSGSMKLAEYSFDART